MTGVLTSFQADLVGFAGSFFIVAAFAYSNMARAMNLLVFNAVNFVGAALLAISLTVNYNLPTMVLEIVWMVIALFGIATRNGIMLVSHIAHLRDEEGVTDHRESIVRGAMERLAPILMTAQATGLALVPVGLGMGQPGSEIQAPMALVILTGLASATALTSAAIWLPLLPQPTTSTRLPA